MSLTGTPYLGPTLALVERERRLIDRTFGYYLANFTTPSFEDPNGRDGEWHAIVQLPHETVEHDGYGVPAFEGDVERIEWERRRRR